METKQNDATYNRPEGDRVLDGPLVRISIPDTIRQIKSEPAWLNGDRNAITLLHNDQLRLVLIALHQHATITGHAVDGASYIQVLQGRIWLETEIQSTSLDEGEGMAIAPGILHSVFAEQETVLTLTLAGLHANDQTT